LSVLDNSATGIYPRKISRWTLTRFYDTNRWCRKCEKAYPKEMLMCPFGHKTRGKPRTPYMRALRDATIKRY
jgi:hypothetical protein